MIIQFLCLKYQQKKHLMKLTGMESFLLLTHVNFKDRKHNLPGYSWKSTLEERIKAQGCNSHALWKEHSK